MSTMRLGAMILLALAGCDGERRDEAAAPVASGTAAGQASGAAPAAPARAIPNAAASPAGPRPLAADLTRAEWRKAENRDACAPVVLTHDGGRPGTARRANFYGGWAVVFDLPGQGASGETRSAYGVAGGGLIAADRAGPSDQERRLRAQWPYFDRLTQLPAPAFAGYGLEGAEAYFDRDPEGIGRQSLAYVRIGAQQCTYNVWSKLGRSHLESLLDALRLLQPDGSAQTNAAAKVSACLMQGAERLTAAPLRAVGTEPFWGARIEGRCVTYSTPENQQGTRVWTRFTPAPGGGVWSGALGGKRFELSTKAAPGCSDGMSDRRYPVAVTLLVGGEQRTGCALPDQLGPL
jgi:uncharacterized membrane protein